MQTSTLLLTTLACALLGSTACARSTQPSGPTLSSAPSASAAAVITPVNAGVRRGTNTPLVVLVTEKHRTQTGAVVVVRVERRGPIAATVALTTTLPLGTSLVRGESKVELPPSDTASVYEAELELAFSAVPTTDLQVVAEYKLATSGARAVGTYRFGRAADAIAPAPKGTDTKMGKWNLGPSVQMK